MVMTLAFYPGMHFSESYFKRYYNFFIITDYHKKAKCVLNLDRKDSILPRIVLHHTLFSIELKKKKTVEKSVSGRGSHIIF